MAEVKIRPGSLEIEIVERNKRVVLLDFPSLTLDKVTVEPKNPNIGPAGDIWPPAPATAGARNP